VDALFGPLGLVSQQALWAAYMSLGLLLAFRFVRSVTSERGGRARSGLVSERLSQDVVSYNTSSALLLVVAAWFTALGVTRQRQP